MFCLSVKMFIFTIVMKSLELNTILSFEIISNMNFSLDNLIGAFWNMAIYL